jgi:hypothetical protein
MTETKAIWLWPAEGIIVSIQAVSTHEYLTDAKRRSGNKVLVGRSNKVLSVENKGAYFAVRGTKRCYSRKFSEKNDMNRRTSLLPSTLNLSKSLSQNTLVILTSPAMHEMIISQRRWQHTDDIESEA